MRMMNCMRRCKTHGDNIVSLDYYVAKPSSSTHYSRVQRSLRASLGHHLQGNVRGVWKGSVYNIHYPHIQLCLSLLITQTNGQRMFRYIYSLITVYVFPTTLLCACVSGNSSILAVHLLTLALLHGFYNCFLCYSW